MNCYKNGGDVRRTPREARGQVVGWGSVITRLRVFDPMNPNDSYCHGYY